jgi:hypothetical protein
VSWEYITFLRVCNFLFDFTEAHSQEFALIVRGDFECGLLNNIGTLKTMGTKYISLCEMDMSLWGLRIEYCGLRRCI